MRLEVAFQRPMYSTLLCPWKLLLHSMKLLPFINSITYCSLNIHFDIFSILLVTISLFFFLSVGEVVQLIMKWQPMEEKNKIRIFTVQVLESGEFARCQGLYRNLFKNHFLRTYMTYAHNHNHPL
jgi:hypothetical protein